MKRKIFLTVTLICGLISFTACSGQSYELQRGNYYLNGETDKPYIAIGENDTMGFYNFDFSEIEKSKYEDYLILTENGIRMEQSKPELTSDEEQEIRDKINLDEQFLNKMNQYTTQDEDGILGLYIPVDNTDLFMYAQFYPSNGKIVFESYNYILKE